MIGGLGLPEILVICFAVVLLFGVKKLPQLGGAIGESIKNFKKGVNDTDPKILDADKGDDQKTNEV